MSSILDLWSFFHQDRAQLVDYEILEVAGVRNREFALRSFSES